MEINEDSLSKIHRVFFHELGHFVARELNKKYFGGFGCKEIRIEPCNTFNYDFIGKTIPEKKNDFNAFDSESGIPMERLAQTLANLAHGCIFQSYYMKQSFMDCFNLKSHGQQDVHGWNGLIIPKKIGAEIDKFDIVNQEYFELLQKNSLLDKFMKINPMDYLEEVEYEKFRVNLASLSSDLHGAIEEYFEFYKEFVGAIQKVINESHTETSE